MPTLVQTILLRTLSNVFMTFAWCGVGDSANTNEESEWVLRDFSFARQVQ